MNDDDTTTPKTRLKRSLRGQGNVFQRYGLWYAKIKYRGRLYRWASHSTRKGDAIALLDQKRRELLDGTYRHGASRVTLAQMRDAHLADMKANGRRSWPRVEDSWVHLYRHLGENASADMIGERIDWYVQTRLAETYTPKAQAKDPKRANKEKKIKKVAPGTVNRELQALRRGFRLMVQRRRLSVVPHIEMLTEDNVRTRFPSPEEVEAVIAHLPERLQVPIRFVAATGWRVGEALGLQWRHVDRRAGLIRLEARETKGKDVRVLPYTHDPRLLEIIEARRAATDKWEREHAQVVSHVFWFPSEDENGQPVASLNRVYGHAWERACKRAKVADLHVHDLRRAFARTAVRAGVDEKTIMRLAGWKTRGVFDRYSIRDHEDLADGVRKLAKAIPGLATSPQSREA